MNRWLRNRARPRKLSRPSVCPPLSFAISSIFISTSVTSTWSAPSVARFPGSRHTTLVVFDRPGSERCPAACPSRTVGHGVGHEQVDDGLEKRPDLRPRMCWASALESASGSSRNCPKRAPTVWPSGREPGGRKRWAGFAGVAEVEPPTSWVRGTRDARSQSTLLLEADGLNTTSLKEIRMRICRDRHPARRVSGHQQLAGLVRRRAVVGG
jgi:hypothetical protein